MTRAVSVRRMRTIDPLSCDLWRMHVAPYVKQSMRRASDMQRVFERGPGPTSNHPVVRAIIRDGRGTDGFQAAMMTWQYLASLAKHAARDR